MRPALHVTLDTLHFQFPDHPPPHVLVRQFAEPGLHVVPHVRRARGRGNDAGDRGDRKSTRLNSSHVKISYAVFCLKKKKKINTDINNNVTMGGEKSKKEK